MSQIITIPAREVVPGMLYDGRVIAKVVGSFGALRPVRPGDREMALVYATPKELNDLCWQHADHVAAHVVPVDGQVAVTLPGPSPTHALCTCGLGPERAVKRYEHMTECIVHQRWYRIWPLPHRVHGKWGWDSAGAGWRAGDLLVTPDSLRDDRILPELFQRPQNCSIDWM